MRMSRWGAAIGGVVAAAVIGAAGCGDSDSNNGGSTPTTSSGVDPDPLNLEIQAVTMPEGDKVRPVVRFRVTDGQGNPIDLATEVAAANTSPVGIPSSVPRFTLAQLDDDLDYTSYYASTVAPRAYTTPSDFPPGFTQPTPATVKQAQFQPPSRTAAGPAPWPVADLRSVGNGVYEYTMPETNVTGLDRTKTHTLAGWVVRSRTALDSDVAYSSFNFVPSGSAPAVKNEVVTDGACNRCHGRLQAHGTRRGTQLCMTCHSPQTSDPDTNRTVDFKVLIHKIHMGEDLPSVRQGKPYYIVGFNQQVVDFSGIAFPFHDGVQHCTVCHTGGATSDNWKTKPSIRTCTSCHDNVKFEAGAASTSCATLPANQAMNDCIHTGGAIAANPTDTQQCLGCHAPGSALGVDHFHHGGK